MKKEYFLRTVNKNLLSFNNFKWNLEIGAINVCPDWNDKPECGGGLHGIHDAIGDALMLNWNDEAIPFVFSATKYVDIDGQKAKVQKAKIEFIGKSIQECSNWIYNRTKRMGGIAVCIPGGDGSTVSGGYGSIVSGGDGSTVSGGNESKVSGGYGSTVSGGYGSTVSGGYGSTVSGGYGSIVSGGDGSKVSGGDGSIIQIKYFDGNRSRIKTGYIGEDGLKPNTKYCLNDKFEFEERK